MLKFDGKLLFGEWRFVCQTDGGDNPPKNINIVIQDPKKNSSKIQTNDKEMPDAQTDANKPDQKLEDIKEEVVVTQKKEGVKDKIGKELDDLHGLVKGNFDNLVTAFTLRSFSFGPSVLPIKGGKVDELAIKRYCEDAIETHIKEQEKEYGVFANVKKLPGLESINEINLTAAFIELYSAGLVDSIFEESSKKKVGEFLSSYTGTIYPDSFLYKLSYNGRALKVDIEPNPAKSNQIFKDQYGDYVEGINTLDIKTPDEIAADEELAERRKMVEEDFWLGLLLDNDPEKIDAFLAGKDPFALIFCWILGKEAFLPPNMAEKVDGWVAKAQKNPKFAGPLASVFMLKDQLSGVMGSGVTEVNAVDFASSLKEGPLDIDRMGKSLTDNYKGDLLITLTKRSELVLPKGALYSLDEGKKFSPSTGEPIKSRNKSTPDVILVRSLPKDTVLKGVKVEVKPKAEPEVPQGPTPEDSQTQVTQVVDANDDSNETLGG